MNRYLFVIAVANLDSEQPDPGDIQFLHTFVDAESADDAYTAGQRALEGRWRDAMKGHECAVANDYVVEVGTPTPLTEHAFRSTTR